MTERVADRTVADEASDFNLQLWQRCAIQDDLIASSELHFGPSQAVYLTYLKFTQQTKKRHTDQGKVRQSSS
jgi:hypothetical protein